MHGMSMDGSSTYSATPLEAMQLVDYVRGHLALPEEIRQLCVLWKAGPMPHSASVIDSCDVVLEEIIHPYDIRLGRYVLQRNAIEQVLGSYEPEKFRVWFNALLAKNRDAQQSAGEAIIQIIEREPNFSADACKGMRDLLFGASARRLTLDEMTVGVDALRSTLQRPIGLVSHPVGWLPKGRCTYWPPEFLDDVQAISERLDIRLFRVDQLVNAYSTDVVFKSITVGRWGYYTPAFTDILADSLAKFAEEVTTTRPAWAGSNYGRERFAATDLISRDTIILSGPFLSSGRLGWECALPPNLNFIGDSNEFPSQSRLVLLEDGVALGPAHTVHEQINSVGNGRYSHWYRGLYFSTTDNSDPNTNGREYAIAIGDPSSIL